MRSSYKTRNSNLRRSCSILISRFAGKSNLVRFGPFSNKDEFFFFSTNTIWACLGGLSSPFFVRAHTISGDILSHHGLFSKWRIISSLLTLFIFDLPTALLQSSSFSNRCHHSRALLICQVSHPWLRCEIRSYMWGVVGW